MRIGILTGGGDCPGLNAVIRAAVLKGAGSYQDEIIGFQEGWRGVLENKTIRLDRSSVESILDKGGTILKTSRTNPFAREDGISAVRNTLEANHLDGLIAIGGEDTLGAAQKLYQAGIPVIGVPKTIDNDLGGTDRTFGFDTAVQIATEAIDRLHTTAESHNRVLIAEVMGRHAGWIALHAGIAGGAHVTLIPEYPFDVDKVCQYINERSARGQEYSIVVVSEGATPLAGDLVADNSKDEFGHVRLGGIGIWLEKEIEEKTGHETRCTVLGHIQRGGSPTAYDRILGSRFGLAAITACHDGEWGKMAGLQGNDIKLVTLAEAVETLRTVPEADYEEAKILFG